MTAAPVHSIRIDEDRSLSEIGLTVQGDPGEPPVFAEDTYRRFEQSLGRVRIRIGGLRSVKEVAIDLVFDNPL